MKELTTEQKAQRYDEVLNKAKNTIEVNQTVPDIVECVESLFPELKENEESNDEEIRKALLELISTYLRGNENGKIHGVYAKDILAWLEKQGEQKPADKVEAKFKIGDWVVYNRTDHSREVMQIYDIRDNRYYFNDNIHFSWSVKECDEKSHLWSIKEAREGDVLAAKTTIGYPNPFIAIYKEHGLNFFNSHCFVASDGKFYTGETGHNVKGINPATKEQRDTLEKAMADAGYTFDFEKKELKKIINKEQIKKNLQDNSFRRMFENKPAEWSEEDERNLNDAILFIKTGTYSLDKEKLIDWLKSLKNRVQPQQEWNKVDKQMIDFAIRAVGLCKQYAINHQVNGYSNLPDVPKKYEELQDWLKSLRPQNRWKPSDEQMKALDEARSLANNCGEESAFDLRTLYEQLKKLREE